MNETPIKSHNFDLAKNRLKEFSEKTEAELEIDNVRTKGGFLGLGNHKVTGSELNQRLETIQKHFITVNTTNNMVIKEFREVYNALDELDKEYITSIVANVKAIEKTSNDVRRQQDILKQHNEELANQQSKLDVHQTEIEKNVANISKIVTALKVFKEKLESYNHLTDIDKVWSDCISIRNEIRVVSDSVTKFSKKVTEDIATANHKNMALSDQVNRDILALHNEANSIKKLLSDLSEKLECTADLLTNQIPVIQETASYAEHLRATAHIDDVDSMWDDISKAKEIFDAIENSFQNMEADILKINEDIQTHQNELDTLAATSAEHKEFIDTLFQKNEDHQTRIKRMEQEGKLHTDKINELEQADDRMRERIDSNVRDINVLKEYKDQLSGISHLDDVDSIWKDVEEHKALLAESEKRDEELTTTVQKNKEDVETKLAASIQETNSTITSLTKKIKYAYWIAGGAAGLAIIELLLLLL